MDPAIRPAAILQSDGACGFYWTKKSGSMYYFYTPALSVSPSCAWTASNAGYFGRLFAIYARNHNNYIEFSYGWSGGDPSTDANLAAIFAQHSDGQQLILAFASFSGHRLLSQITRPDGQSVTYAYDASGDLTDVCDIGNGSTDNSPGATSICGDSTHQHHRYGWLSDHILFWADSPRYTMGWGAGIASLVTPAFDSSGRVVAIDNMGNANFAPTDGITNSTMQPTQPTGFLVYRAKMFSYTSDHTAYADFDGHAANYTFDNTGRVTQTQAYNGSLWLTANSSWDPSNNLTVSIDARGNETDYAYDANGNTTEVALPMVTTSAGTFRPTSVYSYDAYSNVTAYCDAVYSNLHGLNWTTAPPISDSRCPTTVGGGSSVYVYNTSDAAEPDGTLTDTYKPSGYHTQIVYATGGPTGDAGLPTSVASTGFTQVDGTTATPSQGFSYNAVGDLLAYTKLSTLPAAGNEDTLTYDTVNRPTSVTDPDGHTSYRYYAANGAVTKTETAFQHSVGLGPTMQYDADDNGVKNFAYIGGTYSNASPYSPTLSSAPTETDNYYDGDDRLVEVVKSTDPSDVLDSAWVTRYDYDLSAEAGATASQFDGFGAVAAHGNLFKTQEFLPSTSGGALGLTMPSSGSFTKLHSAQWTDIKGGNFDALDRSTVALTKVNQGVDGEVTEQSYATYDDPSALGLTHQTCNAVHQCGTFGYDAEGRTTQITFSDGLSPSRATEYDPDSRVASVTSSVYGAQTYSYDGDGRLTQTIEPSGGGVTASATMNYRYYANGWKTGIDVTSASGGFTLPALFAYSYRSDGLIESQQINDTGNSLVGTTTLSFTRSSAGRLQTRFESGPGSNLNTITNTYDAYGRATDVSYPAGSYIHAEYDASNQELGVGSSVGPTIPATMTYTRRGELIDVATGAPNPTVTNYANGVSVALPLPGWEGNVTWDPQMGVVLGSESDNGNGADNNDTSSQSGFTFDAAGRNTAVSIVNSFPDGLGDGFDTQENSNSTKIYDDENHLVAATTGPFPGNGSNGNQPYNQLLAYNWGPSGHPIQIGSSPVGVAGTTSNVAFETLHWDGDQLLFTTNSAGQLDDVKIGSMGDITPLDPTYRGLTFYDRDFSGTVGFCHNATGAAGAGSTNPYMRNSKLGSLPTGPCTLGRGQTMKAPSSMAWWSGESMTVPGGRWMTNGNAQVGHGTLIGMPRADGITDGFNVIQGKRSYDPTLGSWTTPDANAGDISDPGSQKSYLWNNNNPVSYSDPTGYVASMFLDPSGGDSGDDDETAHLDESDTSLGLYGSVPTGNPAGLLISPADLENMAEYILSSVIAKAGYGTTTAAAMGAAFIAGMLAMMKDYNIAMTLSMTQPSSGEAVVAGQNARTGNSIRVTFTNYGEPMASIQVNYGAHAMGALMFKSATWNDGTVQVFLNRQQIMPMAYNNPLMHGRINEENWYDRLQTYGIDPRAAQLFGSPP